MTLRTRSEPDVPSRRGTDVAGAERIAAELRRWSDETPDASERELLAAAAVALASGVEAHRASERALRASEENYRAIFDASNDAVFVHDLTTGAVLDANRRACELTGATLDDLRRDGLSFIAAAAAPYTPEHAMAHLRQAAAGAPTRFEWLMRRPRGDDVWVEVGLQRATIGGEDRLLALVRDLDDRKRAEEALRASEESYRAIFQGTADGMFLHDPETGALLDANDAACALLGRSVAEMQALGCMFAIDEGYTPERAWPYVQRAIAGEHQRFEWLNRHKDGHLIWTEVTLRRVTVRGEARVLAVARGIDDRRAVEAALRTSEASYRAIFQNASDGMWVHDIETGAILDANDAACRVFGRTVAEQQALGVALLSAGRAPYTLADAMHYIRGAVAGEPQRFEWLGPHKDGRDVWLEMRLSRVTINGVDRILATGRDIGDRKAAEDALRQANEVLEHRVADRTAELARAKDEAEQANRAKSEFLSRMSHELRTPMNSILGFAQLAARSELAPPQARGMQHILKAGRHLLHLINEVLEISRIEAGRENFSLEPVALDPVVREALGLVRPLADQHGVLLREARGPEGVFVHADRQRLLQVLLNLLSNAIKYNRPGGFVGITCVPNDDTWTVRVEDGGYGIPSDRVGELFTPFARLGAEQTAVEGTGLGLALSRRLCAAMGGALELETTGPAGSVFRVALGAAEHPLRILGDTGTFAIPSIAVVSTPGDATLLYVEDNLANLSLVETILLSRPGWRVIPALQGQLGVELAREHLPDVVLLDLHLPDIPGDEVLRRLRADPRTASIPTVVVSADATAASLERLRAAGADAYLTKPLDVDKFLQSVERFLPGERAAGTEPGGTHHTR